MQNGEARTEAGAIPSRPVQIELPCAQCRALEASGDIGAEAQQEVGATTPTQGQPTGALRALFDGVSLPISVDAASSDHPEAAWRTFRAGSKGASSETDIATGCW